VYGAKFMAASSSAEHDRSGRRQNHSRSVAMATCAAVSWRQYVHSFIYDGQNSHYSKTGAPECNSSVRGFLEIISYL